MHSSFVGLKTLDSKPLSGTPTFKMPQHVPWQFHHRDLSLRTPNQSRRMVQKTGRDLCSLPFSMGGGETIGTGYPEDEAEDALRGREERSEGACGPEGKGGAAS
jgi:hypothetical protein